MNDPDGLETGRPVLTNESPVLENTVIKILAYDGQTLTVGYETLADNRPQLNGNTVWLFEGEAIDWAHPGLGVSSKIPSNDSRGSFTFIDVDISRKVYTSGYSVTDSVKGICASATININQLMLAPPSVTLSIETMVTDQLVVKYSTLRGYRPLSSGNWLGLWRGDVLPWDAPPPNAFALPEDDANEGLATFKTILRPQSDYTVIYFMADEGNQTSNTSAAAMLRFVAC